jgi:D-methionine transport system ATP-binding protein
MSVTARVALASAPRLQPVASRAIVSPLPGTVQPAVRFEHVGKVFAGAQGRVTALAHVSLAAAPGEIYGIIGRSGAGKSTLIRCVNLLERPTSGRVFVGGEDVTALDGKALITLRRRIGMVFQHFNLLSSRTVFENVALPLRIAGRRGPEVTRKVAALLDLVGLSDKRDVYPAKLSGGQKQRVGIARALAHDPRLLLCDEATSALDPETTLSILRLLREINRRLGVTVLLITHEMAVIREICDRVAVLDHGHLVEEGRVAEVFAAPQAEATRRLLGAAAVDLPPALAERLRPESAPGSEAVLRVALAGPSAAALFADLARALDIDVRLLHGAVAYEVSGPRGDLIVAAPVAGPKELGRVVSFLADRGARTEVLGHVVGAA